MSTEEHQQLREMLGSYALGHLSPAEQDRVRAHLDGCAACRAELAEIAPLTGLLDRLDPTAFADAPVPPPDLGGRIRAAVAAEDARRRADELAARRAQRRAGTRRRAVAVAAAVAVVAAGVGAGTFLGRATAPTEPVPQTAPRPYEPITLAPVDGAPVQVDVAGLVPHTWGVELEMEAAGFAEGEVYSAAFRDRRGVLQPAGRFLGTGEDPMSCQLQSGVLREDVRAVVVVDDDGRPVLRSRL